MTGATGAMGLSDVVPIVPALLEAAFGVPGALPKVPPLPMTAFGLPAVVPKVPRLPTAVPLEPDPSAGLIHPAPLPML